MKYKNTLAINKLLLVMKKLRDPKKKMSMGQKTNHGINYTSHN